MKLSATIPPSRSLAALLQLESGWRSAPRRPAMTAPAGRTPARRKARQLAQYLRGERPDYAYLKEVFRHLREELDIEVTQAPKKLPYVPTEAEIRAYYEAVWKARRGERRHLDQDPALYRRPGRPNSSGSGLPTLTSTPAASGSPRARAAKTASCPSPPPSRRLSPCTSTPSTGPARCSCSSRAGKSHTSDRGVRKILARYTQAAGITASSARPPAPPLPVHLAEDPGHRRRAHPALQRPRHPPVPGDLLPPRPGRRPAALRRRHRPVPRMKINPVCGW